MYAHISLDRKEEAGVKRQEKACRDLAAARKGALNGLIAKYDKPAYSTATPERWRLDEVRQVADVASYADLDVIGARMAARHHTGGVVTADNRNGRGDTPGLPGFDY